MVCFFELKKNPVTVERAWIVYGREKKAARECLKECGQWKKEAKEAYQVSAIVVVVFIR